MGIRASLLLCAFPAVFFASAMSARCFPGSEDECPAFGRDTVLVWAIRNAEYSEEFVVRIAEFLPDRYVEWEDELSQGTIFMPNIDVMSARGFVNSSLFRSGSDTRGKSSTTLWLSRQIFRELKEKKKTKCTIDGTPGTFTYQGEDRLEVEVNRVPRMLPVIKAMDDRGSQRWFLDSEDNPLMLSHRFRQFDQSLSSITTNKANTLRWIKGKKLMNPPR